MLSTSSRILGRRSFNLVAAAAAGNKQKYPLVGTARRFSEGSHDDFAPKRKVIQDHDEAIEIIKEHIKDNRIMLYMKGNPRQPMCGFSQQVTVALADEGVDYGSVNVLDYPQIREGIKKFSQWPTIPQLYVDGEFIGGCDIIMEMHKSGELAEVLKEPEKNNDDNKES